MNPVILYERIFTAAEITADQEASGFPDDQLANLQPYKRWKGTSSANQLITFNLGAAASADAFGIAGHNLGTIGADVIMQYWNGSTWVNAATLYQPTSDISIFRLFTTQTSDQWRLSLTSMSGTPEIGVIRLGDRLTMEKPLSGTWDPNHQRTEFSSNISKGGNLLQNEVRFRETVQRAEFRRLTDTWYRATFLPAWNAHLYRADPFFFAWDYDRFPDEVGFLRVSSAELSAPYDPVRRPLSLILEGLFGS